MRELTGREREMLALSLEGHGVAGDRRRPRRPHRSGTVHARVAEAMVRLRLEEMRGEPPIA